MHAGEDLDLSQPDGFATPVVGPWTLEKHQKVAYYSSLFSTGMKGRWNCRVYLELFSGAGKAVVRGTGEIIPGSPLLALGVSHPFDRYVFCEQDADRMSALKERVSRYYPERDVKFVEGDVNSSIDGIAEALPEFSKSYRGLTLCFVDPYKMSELSFRTIDMLAALLYVDFLMLIPTYMDIHRNPAVYTRAQVEALDRYLGTDTWRAKWANPTRHKNDFGLFIANELGLQMAQLGFIYEGIEDLELVRMSADNHLPLYHLAFFSKNKLGLQFWRETRKRTNQPSLF